MGTSLSTTAILAGAGIIGTIAGIGSVSTTAGGRDAVVASAKTVTTGAGIVRRRPPQPGDAWGGCQDARAAGTAPIYRGEPGYDVGMDGDGDGIACEPPRD